jgi:integrase
MQFLMIKVFGLRRKEAVMIKPFVCDKGLFIEAFDGTKGGRPRTILVDTVEKRATLDLAKQFVLSKKRGIKQHLGHPDKTLKQNLSKYSNVMTAVGLTRKELGVTSHGLRAEFVIDELARRGIVATIRDGTGQADTYNATQLARLQVSNLVGHGRTGVLTAYSGRLNASSRIRKTPRPNDDESPAESI